VRLEWNLELSRGDMDQVEEFLDIIEAHKMTGVTGASIMFSFFKRWVQLILQRHRLGFEYTSSEDPSRMCAEELSDDAALLRVRRVLLDVDPVPYVSVFDRLPTEGYTQGGKFWVKRRRDQELEGARYTKLRQVRAAKRVIPYVLYGGLYCLGCRMT
jgi:hypothetical protein